MYRFRMCDIEEAEKGMNLYEKEGFKVVDTMYCHGKIYITFHKED